MIKPPNMALDEILSLPENHRFKDPAEELFKQNIKRLVAFKEKKLKEVLRKKLSIPENQEIDFESLNGRVGTNMENETLIERYYLDEKIILEFHPMINFQGGILRIEVKEF